MAKEFVREDRTDERWDDNPPRPGSPAAADKWWLTIIAGFGSSTLPAAGAAESSGCGGAVQARQLQPDLLCMTRPDRALGGQQQVLQSPPGPALRPVRSLLTGGSRRNTIKHNKIS